MSTMTSAELKTMRESLGLPVAWLARAVGVKERSVNYWESGTFAVPKDVGKLFSKIQTKIEFLINSEVSIYEQAIREFGPQEWPETVVLLRYRTDADLWMFSPEFKQLSLPTTTHAAMQARIMRKLARSGHNAAIIYMEPEIYLAWLKYERMDDSFLLRFAWAKQHHMAMKKYTPA